jgi:Cof subfamily protein (haloacid dehalogenase superfamily)
MRIAAPDDERHERVWEGMMVIKMVAVDLDNTLLRSDKTVSEYTKSVFNRLRESGILAAFATSRSIRASARFRSIMNPDFDVTSGGAVATMNGQILFRAAMDMETVTSIIRALKANEGVLHITADTEVYYFSSEPVDAYREGWIDYSDSITTDFSKPLDAPDVFKITTRAISAETVLAITSRYQDVDVLNFTGEDWYQIKSSKAAKHLALDAVCKKLGYEMTEVAAFGDDSNDIEMLRRCGVGVAMANAIDEAKSVADYICGSNNDDGVAKWLERNIPLL